MERENQELKHQMQSVNEVMQEIKNLKEQMGLKKARIS
jgi:cell shape-determining protein MreC